MLDYTVKKIYNTTTYNEKTAIQNFIKIFDPSNSELEKEAENLQVKYRNAHIYYKLFKEVIESIRNLYNFYMDDGKNLEIERLLGTTIDFDMLFSKELNNFLTDIIK